MKNTKLSVRYEAPEVVYVELNVEKGFAGSGSGSMDIIPGEGGGGM